MLTFSYSKSMHVSCGIAGSKASEPVRLVSGQKRESRRYKLIPNWKRWKQKATDHLNEYWRSDYPRQICPADKPVGTHRRPSSALQSSLRFRPTWNIKNTWQDFIIPPWHWPLEPTFLPEKLLHNILVWKFIFRQLFLLFFRLT